MRLFLGVAFRNLIQARRRTFLLSVALSMITMLFVLLFALSEGVTNNILNVATTLAAGHVNVAGFYKTKPTDAFPMFTEVKEIKALIRKNVPDLERVIDRSRGWGKIISNSANMQMAISGIDVEDEVELLSKLQLAPEKSYLDEGGEEAKGNFKDLEQPNTIILFAAQAKRLKAQV